MKPFIDLRGQKFNRLTVIERIPSTLNQPRWKCRCDCGNEHEAYTQQIREGRVKSCGCYRREVKVIHGGWKTRTHSSWRHMRSRCLNPRHKHFKHYGGRGITFCSRWDDFAKFREDMGEAPENHELERIDVNKGYFPENCRWASRYSQSLNTRRNVFLTYKGEKMTMSQFTERHGISYSRFRSRWKIKGMPIEQALEECLNRS